MIDDKIMGGKVSSLKSAIKNDFVIHRFVKLLWLRLCRAKFSAVNSHLPAMQIQIKGSERFFQQTKKAAPVTTGAAFESTNRAISQR